jgi:hypothetical protein
MYQTSYCLYRPQNHPGVLPTFQFIFEEQSIDQLCMLQSMRLHDGVRSFMLLWLTVFYLLLVLSGYLAVGITQSV